jgi:hypothetical protein
MAIRESLRPDRDPTPGPRMLQESVAATRGEEMTPLPGPSLGVPPRVDPRVSLKGSLRGEKTHPTPWKRHTNSVVEGVGRDRYGIADTVLSGGCFFC